MFPVSQFRICSSIFRTFNTYPYSDKWIHFSNTITKAIRMPKVTCRFMIFFFCAKSLFFSFCRSLIKITFNCRGNVVKEQIAKKGAIWRNFFHATMVAKIKSNYFRISELQCGNFGIFLSLQKNRENSKRCSFALNTLISRNFCQKMVRVNFHCVSAVLPILFHTVFT